MGNSNSSSTLQNWYFNVISIESSSPAEQCGLIVDDDFILLVNNTDVKSIGINRMKILIKESEGKEVQLKVFNSRSKDTRDLVLIPCRNWPGSTGLLGMRVRMENISEYTDENPLRSFNEAVNNTQSPFLASEAAIPSVDLLGLEEHGLVSYKSVDSADTSLPCSGRTISDCSFHTISRSRSDCSDIGNAGYLFGNLAVDKDNSTTQFTTASSSIDDSPSIIPEEAHAPVTSINNKTSDMKAKKNNMEASKKKLESQKIKNSTSATANSSVFRIGRSLVKTLSRSSKSLNSQQDD